MPVSIAKLLRRGLDATSSATVEHLKDAGPPQVVAAWVCFELGAQRGEAKAAEAVCRGIQYLIEYAKSQGPPRTVELTNFVPTITPDNVKLFGRAIKLASLLHVEPPEDERDELADVTVGSFPNEHTPPGYMRLVAHHQDLVVYDEILDPIEAPNVLVRVMRGDPELVGDVPVYTRAQMERRRAAGLC